MQYVPHIRSSPNLGCSGYGQVVIVPAFYSDDLSSNPVEIFSLIL